MRTFLATWVSTPLHLSSFCSGSPWLHSVADSESVGGSKGHFHNHISGHTPPPRVPSCIHKENGSRRVTCDAQCVPCLHSPNISTHKSSSQRQHLLAYTHTGHTVASQAALTSTVAREPPSCGEHCRGLSMCLSTASQPHPLHHLADESPAVLSGFKGYIFLSYRADL